ncbi:MAG: glycosyltransferase family 2 protein [Clostridia bacterium]|nr:glycosyltransferase family 2 protein [Clostridia bacterium]
MVSVVIPVYNKRDALAACLDSVLAQDTDVEVICIDDGSTDGSGDILDDYAEKNTNIVVRHTENRGVCVARNTGLELASGDTVAFCDADDTMPQDALRSLFAAMESTGADLVAGAIETETAGGGMFVRSTEPREIVDPVAIAECTMEPLFDGCYGKLYRKELLANTRFEPGRKVNEDGYFVFQCLTRAKKLTAIGNPVYRYRYEVSSVSHGAFSEKFDDILYFGQKKRADLLAMGPSYEPLAARVAAKHALDHLNKMASCRSGYTRDRLCAARRRVLETAGVLRPLPKKERIRLALIRYAFPCYTMLMRRNTKA